MNTSDMTQCPECGSDNIVHNEKLDQVICKDCGNIYEPLADE